MNDKNCPFCGAQITRDAKSCANCGKSFETAQTPTSVSVEADDAQQKANLRARSRRNGFFRAYFGFRGRVGRAEWLNRLFIVLALLVVLAPLALFCAGLLFNPYVAFAAFFVPSLYLFCVSPILVWSWSAVSVQRLHDLGRSGVWIFPPFVVAIASCACYISELGDQYILFGKFAALAVLLPYAAVLAFTPGSRKQNRFGESVKSQKSTVRRSFDFKGRSSGAELRNVFLNVLAMGLAIFALGFYLVPYDDELFSTFFTPLWFAIFFTPILAVSVRRLHDLGKSGKKIVIIGILLEAISLGTIPLIRSLHTSSNLCLFAEWGAFLSIFALAYGFRRGDSEPNRFGEPPTR